MPSRARLLTAQSMYNLLLKRRFSMSDRFLPSPVTTAFLLAESLSAQFPKTSDGHPDLQGVWTNATITPLERPKAFASKPTLNDAEAIEYEKQQAKDLQDVDGK